MHKSVEMEGGFSLHHCKRGALCILFKIGHQGRCELSRELNGVSAMLGGLAENKMRERKKKTCYFPCIQNLKTHLLMEFSWNNLKNDCLLWQQMRSVDLLVD